MGQRIECKGKRSCSLRLKCWAVYRRILCQILSPLGNRFWGQSFHAKSLLGRIFSVTPESIRHWRRFTFQLFSVCSGEKLDCNVVKSSLLPIPQRALKLGWTLELSLVVMEGLEFHACGWSCHWLQAVLGRVFCTNRFSSADGKSQEGTSITTAAGCNTTMNIWVLKGV